MADALDLPGGPAYPISIPGVGDNGCPGMSLRDRFAIQAMPEIIRGSSLTKNNFEWAAARCYEFADAMLAERAKSDG